MAKLVLSLVGKQGAGKSTLGAKLARYLTTEHIEVSDIVKRLSSIEKRSDLASTGLKTEKDPEWLAGPILEELSKAFKTKQTVVLTGVREKEVHDFLKKRGVRLIGVDVTANPYTRYDRVYRLGKVRTAEEFIEQELRERELGVNEVIDAAKFEITTKEDSDPSKLARALVSKIINEGGSVR